MFQATVNKIGTNTQGCPEAKKLEGLVDEEIIPEAWQKRLDASFGSAEWRQLVYD